MQRRTAVLFRVLASMMLASFVLYGAFFTLLSRASAAVAPSNIFTYEGRLLNSNGVPVADATASITFALYSALTGGTCGWSNSSATCASTTARTVTLTDGLFSENLGDTGAATPYAAISDAMFGDDASVFLEVIINGETLTPRKAITAAPYAINSSLHDGLDTTQTGGTSAAVVALDSSGNLTLTGSPQGSSVGQGTLTLNPATGVVATDETLFGVAVSGGSRFRVDGEGDTYLLGDFVVGSSSLIAPFSIDESLNTLRLGDATSDANDPSIVFYASDASDSGTLSYADSDTFTFANGMLSEAFTFDLSTLATAGYDATLSTATLTGTSAAGRNLTVSALEGNTIYSGISGAGSFHTINAVTGSLDISGSTATIDSGYAVSGIVYNAATTATLVLGSGYLAGGYFSTTHDSAATVSLVYGSYSTVAASAGTITTGVAVGGDVATGSGALTTGYGGKFSNTVEGTTRYGVYGEASGGTTALAGYFALGRLQVDTDATVDTPGTATGAGDIFASDAIENDGSVVFGDTTGVDTFTFTSAATTETAATITVGSLTSGTGLTISRAAGGADFDGKMFVINALNSSATSDGTGLLIANNGGGNSVGLLITQNTLSAHGANVTGNNALVLDVNEAAGSENVMIIRSDADGTPDTEFRVESDGDVFGDGANYTSGADYAEFFRTNDTTLGDYQIVCQDPSLSEAVRRCAAGDKTFVMGVVSTNAAFVGNNFRGAGYDLNNDPQYRKIGMVGQIDTLVNAVEGEIKIGDPITTSSTMSGYGAKLHGSARIVGFALEPLASGTGTIRVLIQPQWYGGELLNSDGTVDDSRNEIVLADSGKASRLSVMNTDGKVDVAIDMNGNFSLAGNLFPSDNGTLQTSKYIVYDGRSDVMRTNASGWGSSETNFAEMFPTQDLLAAGEVVVFAENKNEVRRAAGTTYDAKIAGVVTARTGFVAGENIAGNIAVALSGRVPTYVSGENGDIAIGDALTTSSKAGYAMKATEAGQIVGFAMEQFSGATGVVSTFIRPSYFDGVATDAPVAENIVSDVSAVAKLDVSGSMNMNGGSILSIASLAGIGNNWQLLESGDFLTHGRFISLVKSYSGEDVETYGVVGRENTIELSGTSMLVDGKTKIVFEKIDPEFNDIIANTVPYRVLVTPAGMTGTVYVADRDNNGFTIRDTGNTSGVAVDWLVIAYHKDFAPELVTQDVIAEEEASSEAVEANVSEEPSVTDTIDELAVPAVSVAEPEVVTSEPESVASELDMSESEPSQEPEPTPEPEAQPEVISEPV